MAISNSILNKYNKLAETALSDLILDHEILGFTALAMGGIKIVDNSIHPALAWTDYKNIYINAELAEQHGLNGEHIKFLIGHETLHPILLSHLRRGDKDPELWNQATDYAINALLINEGKCCNKRSTGLFIEGGCYKAEFSDMTAEQIYDYLKQHPEENEQPTLPLDFHLDDGDGKGSYEDADGNIQNADVREVLMKMDDIIKTAMAKGNLSIEFRRMLNNLPKVKENWKSKLLHYIKQFDKSDSTWKRPNRRQLSSGFYFPGQRKTERLKIAVGIDTSGSIDQDTLELFFGHVFKICNQFKKFSIKVFCWSTEAHKNSLVELTERNIRSFKIKDYHIESNGGTVAQTGIDYVNSWSDKPDCYICLTDGCIETDLVNKVGNVPMVLAISENYDYEVPSTCSRTTKIKISK